MGLKKILPITLPYALVRTAIDLHKNNKENKR